MIVGASIPACPSVQLRPPPSPAGRGRYNSRATSGSHRGVPVPSPVQVNFWRSSGRAGHGIVPAMLYRLSTTLRTMPMPGNPRPADVRVRPRSQSELGSDRSQAEVGRGARSALATLADHRPGAALPATRQAAGVPSARSQPPPVTPARPRRWGDAGPTAAPAAADQKAGAPGRQLSEPPPGASHGLADTRSLKQRD